MQRISAKQDRIVALVLLSVTLAIGGCADDQNSSHLQHGTQPKAAAPAAIFRDHDAVQIVEDNPESPFVRVESLKYGDTFYAHRDYVQTAEDGHVIATAADLYQKPVDDADQYFTLREINQMRAKIPALFRTYPSAHDVVASWKAAAPFLHEGELAWPVYECKNPNCPGRDGTASDHGVLYILPREDFTPEELARLRENPQLVYQNQTPDSQQGPDLTFGEIYACPHCRNLPDRETNRAQYATYVSRYQLPEAVATWQRLETEYQRGRNVRSRRFGDGAAPSGS